MNCTTSQVDYDLSETLPTNKGKAWTGYDIFASNVKMKLPVSRKSNALNLTVQLQRERGCGPGQLDFTACILEPSVVVYNLTLDRGNIVFQSGSWRSDVVSQGL